MKIRIQVLIFACIFLFTSSIQARHILSGSMGYTCLGNDEFQISMIIYRDCYNGGALFDNPAIISLFNSSNQLSWAFEVPLSSQEVINPEPYEDCPAIFPTFCVEKAVYEMTITLPPGDDYVVAYQRCCWSSEMSNIDDPLNRGITVMTTITELAQQVCNTQPTIDMPLSFAACPGVSVSVPIEAFDAEGDSLAYEFCMPYEGGGPIGGPDFPGGNVNGCDGVLPNPTCPPPYQQLPFAAGFDIDNPFPTANGITIDPVAGTLEFTPTLQGRYIHGLCITEYRDGQVLSFTTHNIETSSILDITNNEEIFPANNWELIQAPQQLLFKSNTLINKSTFSLVDISGRNLITENFQQQSEFEINTSNLEPGIYFANIVNGNAIQNFQVVIVR